MLVCLMVLLSLLGRDLLELVALDHLMFSNEQVWTLWTTGHRILYCRILMDHSIQRFFPLVPQSRLHSITQTRLSSPHFPFLAQNIAKERRTKIARGNVGKRGISLCFDTAAVFRSALGRRCRGVRVAVFTIWARPWWIASMCVFKGSVAWWRWRSGLSEGMYVDVGVGSNGSPN